LINEHKEEFENNEPIMLIGFRIYVTMVLGFEISACLIRVIIGRVGQVGLRKSLNSFVLNEINKFFKEI